MKAKPSGLRPALSKVSSAPVQRSKKEDAAEYNPAAASIFLTANWSLVLL
jgi:hypothetical protein